MQLGAFSTSLAVKDIKKSKEFYTALGFKPFGGDEEQGWLILRNGSTVIGLFQGMFEKNLLTFNPGWAQDASELEEFQDVREIAVKLKSAGYNPDSEVEGEDGPGSFMITDPDGNQILFDQHR
ncbi:MAG: VOC family protein [Spirochaetales bacterium]|uniref:VOC family protein n=1 Tax=Candidatus Thalassospirochaeta sargassi TaxID=3119039 RepID=A0AAJ1IGJ8_9SPIO|nr:VOC family protein [Spirochaetales bacterium]